MTPELNYADARMKYFKLIRKYSTVPKGVTYRLVWSFLSMVLGTLGAIWLYHIDSLFDEPPLTPSFPDPTLVFTVMQMAFWMIPLTWPLVVLNAVLIVAFLAIPRLPKWFPMVIGTGFGCLTHFIIMAWRS